MKEPLVAAVLALLLALLLGPREAGAADYYVRVDGDDGCDGRTDAPGGPGSCAFRTIRRCNDAAGCGDACRVAPGDYHEVGFSIEAACFTSNVDVHNSWICSLGFFDGTWDNGDHQLDLNLYPMDHRACFVGGSRPISIQGRRFSDLPELQRWDGDLDGDGAPDCPDCVLEPSSVSEPIEETFVRVPPPHDDTAPRDLDLRETSLGVDLGDPAFGSGVDVEGAPRVGDPDTGAYEALSEPAEEPPTKEGDGGPPAPDGGTAERDAGADDEDGSDRGEHGCACREGGGAHRGVGSAWIPWALALLPATGSRRRRRCALPTRSRTGTRSLGRRTPRGGARGPGSAG